MSEAFDEYRLAIETQMHFNEILMKFRSLGITVVVAIFSFAVTREMPAEATTMHLYPAQLIVAAGILLTIVLGTMDTAYFLQLLLGAVDRSLALEAESDYRLTSSICARVKRPVAVWLVVVFYSVFTVLGVALIFLIPKLPRPA